MPLTKADAEVSKSLGPSDSREMSQSLALPFPLSAGGFPVNTTIRTSTSFSLTPVDDVGLLNRSATVDLPPSATVFNNNMKNSILASKGRSGSLDVIHVSDLVRPTNPNINTCQPGVNLSM